MKLDELSNKDLHKMRKKNKQAVAKVFNKQVRKQVNKLMQKILTAYTDGDPYVTILYKDGLGYIPYVEARLKEKDILYECSLTTYTLGFRFTFKDKP